jgi:hypothetical protein
LWLIFATKNILQQAVDPALIKRAARGIARFPEPLPSDYRFGIGLDLASLKMITIEHEPDKQQIFILSQAGMENSDDKSLGADAVVKRIYDAGITIPTNGPSLAAHFVDKKSEGEIDVAGKKMFYIVGWLTDNENNKLEGLVGCILLKSAKQNDRSILVYALQPDGKPYNFDVTKKLLESISAFDL